MLATQLQQTFFYTSFSMLASRWLLPLLLLGVPTAVVLAVCPSAAPSTTPLPKWFHRYVQLVPYICRLVCPMLQASKWLGSCSSCKTLVVADGNRSCCSQHMPCPISRQSRPLPGQLGRTWVYDGISPFIPQAIKVQGNNMRFPLVGRGGENPLKQVQLSG